MSETSSLPKGWSRCALGDLIRIVRGVSYTKDQASQHERDGLVPLLRATNIDGRLTFDDLVYVPRSCVSDDQFLRPGDIVIAASSGSRSVVGKAAILKSEWDGSFGAFCMALRPFDGVEASFLGWLLQTEEYRETVSRLAAGTNINNLKREHLEQFPVRLPPIAEQGRLVCRIEQLTSDLDAGVAALERARANLKRYRAAVLKAAVEGRLTERWRADNPPGESGEELLARILTERRRRWEEKQLAAYAAKRQKPPKDWREKYREPQPAGSTSLPALPEGWRWASLGQIALFQNGRAFPSASYSDEGVRLLRPGNLFEDGSVRWNEKNTRRLPESWAGEHPGYLVRGNEIIMNLTAQSLADEFLGRVCLTASDERCLLNQRLARITPQEGINPAFMLTVLKSRLFRSFVNELNTGSLIQHMFTSQLDAFAFPLPPIAEQVAIADCVQVMTSAVERTSHDLDAARRRGGRLRQSVLGWAFEGRLVPQDPTDEPANVLLERLRQERAVSDGTIGKTSRNGQPLKSRKAKSAAGETP